MLFFTGNSTQGWLTNRISEYIRGNLYSVRNFTELDKNIQFQIECLIKYLQSKNVEIEIFLAPYHPDVDQVVEKGTLFKSCKQ